MTEVNCCYAVIPPEINSNHIHGQLVKLQGVYTFIKVDKTFQEMPPEIYLLSCHMTYTRMRDKLLELMTEETTIALEGNVENNTRDSEQNSSMSTGGKKKRDHGDDWPRKLSICRAVGKEAGFTEVIGRYDPAKPINRGLPAFLLTLFQSGQSRGLSFTLPKDIKTAVTILAKAGISTTVALAHAAIDAEATRHCDAQRTHSVVVNGNDQEARRTVDGEKVHYVDRRNNTFGVGAARFPAEDNTTGNQNGHVVVIDRKGASSKTSSWPGFAEIEDAIPHFRPRDILLAILAQKENNRS